MKRADFFKEVKTEAKSLRNNITKEERGNLDFKTLKPESPSYCIYGQLTGDCWSDRAVELYKKKYDDIPAFRSDNSTFSDCIANNVFEPCIDDSGFTALEIYIMLKGAKKKSLIKYLKKEIKDWNP